MHFTASFNVYSEGFVYSPIPRNRSLVPANEHRHKPDFYNLILIDNDETSPLLKSRILKHFFTKSVADYIVLGVQFERQGRIAAGPYTYEVGNTKRDEIHADGQRLGYSVEMVLERA